jgi:Acyclic terpene utilisation family protein AtuA
VNATRTIGAAAGFAGDRISPATRLAESGLVDDLAMECLAERTMVHALRRRRADPSAGYDPRLRARLTPLLPHLAAGRLRVVGNLGGANPVAAAEALAQLVAEHGLPPLRIAAIVGDDVEDRADSIAWLEPQRGERIGALAYLGSDGIAAAFAEDASVVITGRVADSALFAGAVREVLDGGADAMAGALLTGHLLECSAQLTGGNFTAPGGGRLPPAELAAIGYPIATVSADGSVELALVPGVPGRVDRLTCTLQMLYEVHDPSRYITPDGVLDLTGVVFEEIGPARVRATGARLGERPAQLKVAGFFSSPGQMVDVEIGYAGPEALQRARDAAEVFRIALEDELGIADATVDLVGVDSLLGDASAPLRCEPPEVRLHTSVACGDAELARGVEDLMFWLTIAGPAHGGGIRVERREHVAVADGRIDRDVVREEVVWVS